MHDDTETEQPVKKVSLKKPSTGGPIRRRDVKYNDPINFVTSRFHPLQTGIVGKLYNRHDRVTPIVDAIGVMLENARSNGNDNYMLALRREQERRATVKAEEEMLRQPVVLEVPKKAKEKPKVKFEDHPDPQAYVEGRVDHLNQLPGTAVAEEQNCPMCDTPVNQATLSEDKDAYVCSCGTVLHQQNVISNNRQKNCHESEDKTIVADAVYNPRLHRLEQPALSAEESRRERMREQSLTVYNPKAAKKQGFGFVQQQINRQAAVEARKQCYVTQSNPYGWSPAERSKSDQLMRELEKLLNANAPISQTVKVHLRSNTLSMWTRVVQHDRVCKPTSSNCKLCLSSRTIKSVAESAFFYHIDRLLHGDGTETDISHEEVRTLKERATSKAKALNAHMVSTRAMVSLIMEQQLCQPCVDSTASSPLSPQASPTVSRPESPSLVHSPERVKASKKLVRNDSLIPKACENIPGVQSMPVEMAVSPLLAFRQSILRVHKLFQSMLPLTVKEKAMSLLAHDKFTSALYASDANPTDREARSAFALLVALENTRPKNGKERISNCVSNVQKLIGLQEDEANLATLTVQSLLPESTWIAASTTSEEFEGLL